MCSFALIGDIAKSDKFGNVLFDNFQILRGPEGMYELTVYNPDFKVKSKKVAHFFKSNVGSLEILTAMPKIVTIGEKLQDQPKVKVLSESGKPIGSNRTK